MLLSTTSTGRVCNKYHYLLKIQLAYSSDVVRVSASGFVDSGLIPSRVKPLTLKLVFTASCWTLSVKGIGWRTNLRVYLLRRLETFKEISLSWCSRLLRELS